MPEEYAETGGLRWSLPCGLVTNLSWPIARIRISPQRIQLTPVFRRVAQWLRRREQMKKVA